MDQLPSVAYIAAAINNEGVANHRCGRWEEAAVFYKSALDLLRESVESQMAANGERGNRELYKKWKAKFYSQVTINFSNGLCGYESSLRAIVSDQEDEESRLESLTVLDPVALMLDGDLCEDTVFCTLLFNTGVLRYRSGEIDKASRLLEMARSVSPKQFEGKSSMAALAVSINFNLGLIYYEGERLDDSMRAFVTAVEVGMQWLGNCVVLASALTRIGHILLAKGNVGEAANAFNAASMIYNQHPIEMTFGAQADDFCSAPAA